MTPLLLVLGGAVAVAAGVATLRSLGPGYRIGRLLATVPKVPLADALRIVAGDAPRRYVAVEGRIDSDEPFEDVHQRPLVLRRTRIEVRAGRRWTRVEDSLEAVPFQVGEGLDAIAVDAEALGDGLVVIPRISEGVAADLADRIPAGFAPDAPARATIEQVSSVEHATVIGWPTTTHDGRPVMTAGAGRPLVLSVLDPDEAMRVLAHGDRLRPRLAAALFVAGLVLAALGLAWVGAEALGMAGTPVALAAAPSASAAPAPSGLAGDTRSSGEGPGLVGAPGLAIAGVLLVGAAAVGATLLYVRLTGGPRRT